MYQFKTQFLVLLFLAISLSACSKKPTGVKATVKTGGKDMNQQVSSQADQQASSINAIYKIQTVSIPNQTENGYSVDVELVNPANEVLPFTTLHNGSSESTGTYSDTARNVQVILRARCSNDDCFKYTLLVTVTRAGQTIYQSGAVSYANDCKFNSISSSGLIGKYFANLTEFENYATVGPVNDIETCTQ